jgi:hypothetical protein
MGNLGLTPARFKVRIDSVHQRKPTMKRDITELVNSAEYTYLTFDPSRLVNLLTYLDENTIPALVGFNAYGRVAVITPYNSGFEDWARYNLHLVKMAAPLTSEQYIHVIMDTTSPIKGFGFWVDMSDADELELWPSSKKRVNEIYHDTGKDRFIFDIKHNELFDFIQEFKDQHPEMIWGVYPPGSQEVGSNLEIVKDWREDQISQSFKGHLVSFQSSFPRSDLNEIERRLITHGIKVDTMFDYETGAAFVLFPHSLPLKAVEKALEDVKSKVTLPANLRLETPDDDGYHTVEGNFESRCLSIGKLRAEMSYHHGCTCLRWEYTYADRMTVLQWLINCGLELTLSHDGNYDYLLLPLVLEDAGEELKQSLQAYLGDNEVLITYED